MSQCQTAKDSCSLCSKPHDKHSSKWCRISEWSKKYTVPT